MNNYNWNDAFPDTPESFKNKISATLKSLPNKKESCEMKNKKVYRRGSFKKRVMIGLVAAMAIGTTVFAASKIIFISSSSNKTPIYTSIPTEKQVKDDFGFSPKLVKKFDNGYTFKDANAVNNKEINMKGESVEKSKSLYLTYTKGNDKLNIYIGNKIMAGESEEKDAVDNYNDIDLFYTSYNSKCVPADYEMTEQDKKDEASGKCVFSYGTDKVEVSKTQFLRWKQDGINYCLLPMDSDVSQDELVEMAHQVIDAK